MVEEFIGPGVFSKDQEDKDGIILTKEYGFLVTEEEGKVLSFDKLDNPEYGNVLLFGDQVFFLKFWDTESLEKAQRLVTDAISHELQRRRQGV